MQWIVLLEERKQSRVKMMLKLLSSINRKSAFLNERLHSGQDLSIVLLHRATGSIAVLIRDDLVNVLECDLRLIRIIRRNGKEDALEYWFLDNP